MEGRTRYLVRRVLASAAKEELITARIPLPEPAGEILELRKSVLIDRVDVTLGSVILQGRLRVQYLFPALSLSGGLDLPTASPGARILAYGPVMALSAEISLLTAISVAPAAPGMEARVVDAYVQADTSGPVDVDAEGRIRVIRDESIVHLSVDLLAEEEVSPAAGLGAGAARRPSANAGARPGRLEAIRPELPATRRGSDAVICRFPPPPR